MVEMTFSEQYELVKTTDSANPVELDWYSEEDTVSVTPRDQLRFDIHKDKAIKALQLANEAEQFQLQLRLLLQELAQWMRTYSSKVDTGYLTLRDARLSFLAISKEPECDDDLEDAISRLDFEIANNPDLELLQLNALILPPASPESLGSFFDDRFLLVYRGLSK